MHNASEHAYMGSVDRAKLGLCILLASSTYVSATVLEFDKDGQLSVSETKPDAPAVLSPPASAKPAELVALTREVAHMFSGSVGVRKAGLDALTFVEVFEALIKAESNFNPNAVSPKGAVGLGQLMPDTASDMGVTDPFDPRSNLIGSAKYFTMQLAEFGSLELALAAYDAGPDRVKHYEGVPPFSETKSYVSAILGIVRLPRTQSEPAVARPLSVPINTEQPLKGDVSVWEF